ncbi:hypothetical protein EUTSA_v10006434mg [Eutrema salsugineum]|uniref:C2 domain-containing protein n=1 Tax=Eutrema salsugineum TaxID=72664 RepID=V4LJI3_EUTSA|nr:FT-interacting protein 1 [Eutrema salsugineum]ESQ43904.1 hypothetical protein EUTSA_v10006434mg [Eutrema salsugineum]
MADFSVKKISPKLGGERGTRNPSGPTSSYDLVEQMEFLYVEVIKATNNSRVNPIPHTCIPIVEITLGNFKSSTRDLPIGPNREWNQVFAFDKTKGDVLSVTLIDGYLGTVIGKQNFKLAADIPSRVPPEARMAPQWYSIQNSETGYDMALLMSIWFGTQADEVYSNAWFSDASLVSASCVTNTRPKLYLAPRLCYVRVTIVSGHDLISSDGKRSPSIYVKATLDNRVTLKTGISSGSNPSWNQDLIFVASEPLQGTVCIELVDKVDDQHETCVGKLKKIRLSEMTAVKVPGGPAPLSTFDVEPPSKVEPAGDTRRFASTIKVRLATDQSYHVFDECSQYCSDYRAFAKGLWPGTVGKLEVGILGATGLTPMKNSRNQRNAYVVAKYGNKWARTRTVVDNASPKWNEQYSWDVYDKSTVFTLGVYDNQQLVSYSGNKVDDAPIGKVRFRLSKLKWDTIYTGSYPILVLGKEGLKKMGEIQLAIRCASSGPLTYAFATAPFRWMLPKSHYKSPLSLLQIEALRSQAVEVNCMNLAKTEPMLRSEVVKDMLKPKSNNFSLRRAKANYERLCRIFMWLSKKCALSDIMNIRSNPDNTPKCVAFLLCCFVIWVPYVIPVLLWLAIWRVYPICAALMILYEVVYKLLIQGYHRIRIGTNTPPPPPPLVLVDLKLSKLDSLNLDELAEEFDAFPSSEADVHVLKMRYDRLRKLGEKMVTLMGDAASQCERLCELWTICDDNPIAKISFLLVVGFVVLPLLYSLPFEYLFKYLLTWFLVHWFNFTWDRNDLPSAIKNFFRRLPTNEDLMI